MHTPKKYVFITLFQLYGLYNVFIGLVGVKEVRLQHDTTLFGPTLDNLLIVSGGSASADTDDDQGPDDVQIQLKYHQNVDKIAILVIDAMRITRFWHHFHKERIWQYSKDRYPAMLNTHIESYHCLGLTRRGENFWILDSRYLSLSLLLDFLVKHSDSMPFLRDKIRDGRACVFYSIARSPTVTLPRIKALITGDIPTYYDVISNLASSEINSDNLIDVAVSHGKKIVFYGDDTWIKLLPGRFARSEGVTSFFVTDFYEVDKNVSRRLHKELQVDSEWDLLILHYLGLDHIGHVHGPESNLIPTKLQEMDSIASKIWSFLNSKQQSLEKEGNNNNPLPSYLIVTSDHGMANQGGHGGNSFPEVLTPMLVISSDSSKKMGCSDRNETIEQLDFSPTISSLWGHQFPKQCVGKIITSWAKEAMNPEQLLSSLLYNLNFMKGILIDGKNSSKKLNIQQQQYHKLLRTHFDYLKEKEKESVPVSGQEANFLKLVQDYEKMIDTIITPIRDNFKQDLFRMLFGAFILFEAQLLTVVETPSISTLRSKIPFCCLLTLPSVFYSVELFITLCSILILSQSSKKLLKKRNYFSLEIILTYSSALLLFSSSFVEEEQYLKYYLLCTAIFCTILFSQSEKQHMIKALLSLVIHKISSNWNQTGQKWSHLHDLSDSVRDSGVLLNCVMIATALSTLYLRRRSGLLTHVSIILIVLFKGDFMFETSMLSSAQMCWLAIFVNLLISLVRKPSKAKWRIQLDTLVCTSLLLSRDYNTPLIPMILYLTKIFDDSFLFFLVHASFFYQGNSNNIASVDVNSGYIGLTSYNDSIVGTLIFLNTFTGPILIVFSFIEKTLLRDCSRLKNIVNEIILTNGWTIAIYSIVVLVMRNHLFVWSVFAPKLLYLFMFTFLNLLIALTYNFITLILTYF